MPQLDLSIWLFNLSLNWLLLSLIFIYMLIIPNPSPLNTSKRPNNLTPLNPLWLWT
uniref:ATP synthase F0 subunit 8 n=1 Tax=Ophioceres incipiens TaxID=1815129 RepID=A0A3G2WIS4_9ECHI|nr:ATP synthase F0 subunit 8 [Ophioceres incipiens]AYO99639.1 ATP synthase F0 subunit 8 [Ophioceres incipiens]